MRSNTGLRFAKYKLPGMSGEAMAFYDGKDQIHQGGYPCFIGQ